MWLRKSFVSESALLLFSDNKVCILIFLGPVMTWHNARPILKQPLPKEITSATIDFSQNYIF